MFGSILEVPELIDGVVEIKAVAREPGHRTKLAVASNDQNVDPVGACVGARGMRVRQVVNELRGEKVDIVPYSDQPQEFVMRALAPAKVREVRIHEDTGIAEVIVPDFQLSLAIGKEGQNARLAARLTGWRVDIKSETQLAEDEAGGEFAEGEWVEGADGELMWQPAGGGEAISAAEAGYADAEVTGAGDSGEAKTDEQGAVDEADPETLLEDAGVAAEEAAMHVETDAADVAADELASDADLDGEDLDVRAEAEADLEEDVAAIAAEEES